MLVNIPSEEEKIIELWKELKAFETSIELSKDRPVYSFYDGPPFATGMPHYGHLLASTIKDTVTRYAHSNGFYIERRFGWDTHGLPVEYEIDKKLGISSRDDVYKLGIEKYNSACRAIVMRYSEAWRATMTRIGRWIDFDNDYKTLQPSYMESVWWVFGELYKKGLVYRGFRVMPYSTACTTPLSNFEAQLNYKEVIDPTIVVSFPLESNPEVELLAWTTTPWTLPSHTSLCVNPDFNYCMILDKKSGRKFILLEKLLSTLYKDPRKAEYEIVEKAIAGKEMIGWRYKPLFDYFVGKLTDKAFTVIGGAYVTADSGVGIVHQAPAFGEEDYNCAVENGVIDENHPPPDPINDRGIFTQEVSDFAGMYVKDADKAIVKHLKNLNRIVVFKEEKHSYPFCWRSDTPLLYRAVPAWFVKVKDHTSKLLKALENTCWVPENVKDGRFGNWVASARDWNVSRNRYWGTPIPIWASEDFQEVVCISSVQELEELSGVKNIKDLHRENIDKITIPSRRNNSILRRIEEVFDCWFESGSMPYASIHYPFENCDEFEKRFPASFIAEGIDQTRGWFYTLLVLGTLLFGKAPYKNVITHGLVLAADGKKMSKRLKNYPDPNYILDTYGSDALRMYLISSPVVRGENLRFQEQGVKEIVSKVLLPWFNSFKFLEAQIELFEKTYSTKYLFSKGYEGSDNVMDKWILTSVNSLIIYVRKEMDSYRLYTVISRLLEFIDILTNCYIRFNRKRLKGQKGKSDTFSAINSLFDAIFKFAKMMSSFTPFMSETIYQSLKGILQENENLEKSIHFVAFPDAEISQVDLEIERKVKRMRAIVELGRYLRENNGVPLKIPIRELTILHHSKEYLDDVYSLKSYIVEELNIRNVITTENELDYKMTYSLVPDWTNLGKKLRRDMAKVKQGLQDVSSDEAKNFMMTKFLKIGDITLTHEDLQVKREIGQLKSTNHKVATDGEVFVIMDFLINEELSQEGLSREIVNRVQQLRKKANLKVIDDVQMQYEIVSDPINLQSAIETNEECIEKILRGPLVKKENLDYDYTKLIIEQEYEISGAIVSMRLLNN